MDLGIHLVRFDWSDQPGAIADGVAAAGRAADAAGVASLSLMDHYFQLDMIGPAQDPMLEGYTTLGFLAAATERVRLKLLCTGVTYRHPGLLAKIIATLDVLSGGRAVLGIGAAWYEREHRALGVPFPPLAERFERLAEALAICTQMWSDDDGPYTGRHYQLTETVCSPRPLQRPRPMVLVGGGGERKTLRLVATSADACNLIAAEPDQVRHKLEVLRGHCEAVGRDPATVRRTILYVAPIGEPAAFLAAMREYARLGVDEVIVVPERGRPDAWIERVAAPLVGPLAELGAG